MACATESSGNSVAEFGYLRLSCQGSTSITASFLFALKGPFLFPFFAWESTSYTPGSLVQPFLSEMNNLKRARLEEYEKSPLNFSHNSSVTKCGCCDEHKSKNEVGVPVQNH